MTLPQSPHTTEEYSYRGTVWRYVAYWRDTGGEDGITWKCDLEWKDQDGNWHTEEAWWYEKDRRVPIEVKRWHLMCRINTCPRHRMDHMTLRCSLCGVERIDMESLV